MISTIKYLYYLNYLLFKKYYDEGKAYMYAPTPVVILLGLNSVLLVALPLYYIDHQLYFEVYPVVGGSIGLLILFFLSKKRFYLPILTEVESYTHIKKLRLKVYSAIYIFVTVTLYILFLVYYPRPVFK